MLGFWQQHSVYPTAQTALKKTKQRIKQHLSLLQFGDSEMKQLLSKPKSVQFIFIQLSALKSQYYGSQGCVALALMDSKVHQMIFGLSQLVWTQFQWGHYSGAESSVCKTRFKVHLCYGAWLGPKRCEGKHTIPIEDTTEANQGCWPDLKIQSV